MEKHQHRTINEVEANPYFSNLKWEPSFQCSPAFLKQLETVDKLITNNPTQNFETPISPEKIRNWLEQFTSKFKNIEEKDVRIILIIARHHLDILLNFTYSNGFNFLFCLSSFHNGIVCGILRFLLQFSPRFDPNCQLSNTRGDTLLFHAMLNQNRMVVCTLLESGANVNLNFGPIMRTCLHYACEIPPCRKYVELLMSYGARIDQPDICGITPQELAAQVDKRTHLFIKKKRKNLKAEQNKVLTLLNSIFSEQTSLCIVTFFLPICEIEDWKERESLASENILQRQTQRFRKLLRKN